MSAILSGLYAPFQISGGTHLTLLLPLSLFICIVYKTIRCETLKEIPMASLALWVTMVIGMYAVGVGIWLVNLLLA